jgi:hypothetical protein
MLGGKRRKIQPQNAFLTTDGADHADKARTADVKISFEETPQHEKAHRK